MMLPASEELAHVERLMSAWFAALRALRDAAENCGLGEAEEREKLTAWYVELRAIAREQSRRFEFLSAACEWEALW
ncbi:MAG: hypothetical protein ACYDCA_09540 [Candidatus Tyrphobacter sp.]